jgi:hypothetical protein
MKKLANIVCVISLVTSAAAADVPGSGDNPLIPRYPGSEIITYSVKDYDEYRMATGPRSGGNVESQKLEGKLIRMKYRLSPTERSDLEVLRNYRKALGEQGFEVTFECGTEDECGTGFFYQIIYKINRMPIENLEGSRYLTAHLARPQGDVTVALAVQALKLPSTKEKSVDVALDIDDSAAMDVGLELSLADDMARDIDAQGRALV